MTSVTGVTGSGGSSSVGGPPPNIKALLDQYGIQPTGSLAGDKAAIAAAKAAQGQDGTQAAQGGKPPKPPGGGPPPEILQQLQALGLQPQGSLEADLAAIQAAKSNSSGSSTDSSTSSVTSLIQQLNETFKSSLGTSGSSLNLLG